MINQDKWINTIPKKNLKNYSEADEINQDKWINTIPKKNYLDSFGRYTLLGVLFVCGLIFVSAVKNETRNVQKEINELQTSIDKLQFNLDQAILDHEVITSPENIYQLAKKNLNSELVFYKRSQIKNFNIENKSLSEVAKINKSQTKEKKMSKDIKLKLAKKIEEKKLAIKKLQELYNQPENIPTEVKKKVSDEINHKKLELKNIAESPKDIFKSERLHRWTVVQVVKLFLGMPIIPGR
tara:strand:+ start:445 stop:1161 length:717 start_codon:yes stop_codon:yes gene_type:complete